jgi:hypothetical protein
VWFFFIRDRGRVVVVVGTGRAGENPPTAEASARWFRVVIR